ncbi:hypothetical protein C5167_040315 [Papaver somniferum]|uniref:Uncharacterized protein n=1 Tax=Papaver somniferum TaxID=3469 RepID=A0A4Y7II29_PAPSO|nr:hypothetical protein C5167_040315 [Papaver somniferum]
MMMLLISELILSMKKKKRVFDNLSFGLCGLGNLSLKGILHQAAMVALSFEFRSVCIVVSGSGEHDIAFIMETA